MGLSLTGLDTSFSSGLEFWSSWQLDCSQPGGRVPVTEVMSGGAGLRESQNTGGVDFGSIVCAIKMLVIGSCTGDTNVRDCPGLLTQDDLDASSLFQCREAELSAWALPARELYPGWQHRYMMTGVDAIRHRFGTPACSVKIISAGYGLIDEEQRLVPYEATFQGQRPKWIRDRSTMLGIPSAVRN